jgi:hypothetical protein
MANLRVVVNWEKKYKADARRAVVVKDEEVTKPRRQCVYVARDLQNCTITASTIRKSSITHLRLK